MGQFLCTLLGWFCAASESPAVSVETYAPVMPVPVTPSPITSTPATSSPVGTLSPVTWSPVTPSPVTLSPATLSPVTSSPVTPSPVTPVPVGPEPGWYIWDPNLRYESYEISCNDVCSEFTNYPCLASKLDEVNDDTKMLYVVGALKNAQTSCARMWTDYQSSRYPMVESADNCYYNTESMISSCEAGTDLSSDRRICCCSNDPDACPVE